MPIYEYQCRECGTRFEAIRRLSDNDKDLTCPECGTPGPEKVFSTFAATTVTSAGCSSGGG